MDMSGREVSAVVRFDRYADRLRLKGQVVRITDFDGEPHDYRVADVSMPDESGAVHVSLTETTAPASA